MKTFILRIAAIFCAATACTAAAAPASAAESAPADEAAPVVTVVESVISDYVPTSTDVIAVHGKSGTPLHIKVVQHSPERENLVMYDNQFEQAENPVYMYHVEPGQYTVTINYPLVYSGPMIGSYVSDFTIENADYSAEPEIFSQTQYGIELESKFIEAQKKAESVLTNTETQFKAGAKQIINSVTLERYDCHRGDYNNDTKTDLHDSRDTLKEYVYNFVGTERDDAANPMQIASCDIDADGKIGLRDQRYILTFYTTAMVKLKPTWPDGIEDVRFKDFVE
ncbi:MAG: hypothetical protein K5705_13055 [Oscillospiraceae bacterium]|nr:hypothetical protein [Oscillospiraceae bacterium]